MTVVFKLLGIKDVFLLQNSDGRVADCRELLIMYAKEGRSESMQPSNNEATIVIVIVIKNNKSRLL